MSQKPTRSCEAQGVATTPGVATTTIKQRLIWLGLQLWDVPAKDLQLRKRARHLRCAAKRPQFAIQNWYGRFGNNIQQILIAMAHAEAFGGRFDLPSEALEEGCLAEMIAPFGFDCSGGSELGEQVLSNFFHYTEYSFNPLSLRRMRFKPGYLARRECLLSRGHLESCLHRLARLHLMPHLRCEEPALPEARDSELVIHLRAGDVGSLGYDYYLSNPLWYYEQLARLHRRALIVMEPGPAHALVAPIADLFDRVTVVSGSLREDFQRLLSARFLASSGVSTFPVAAALMSRSLRTFYASDAYQTEHLNPRMIDGRYVKLCLIKMPGYLGLWRQSRDRLQLLHRYSPSRVWPLRAPRQP